MSTVFITGCSSGFGFIAAKKFSAKGDKVIATMRNPNGKNKASADGLKNFASENKKQIEILEMDVTSNDSVKNAAEYVLTKFGSPDVIINNAGQMYVGLAEAFTSEELTNQLDVNIVGIHRVTRAFLPKMRERGTGLFINVSSVAGRFASPFFAVYHASKWGLEGYSLALRRELASSGIDVVVVEPGPFTTELFPQSPQPIDKENRVQSYPEIVHNTFNGMTEAFVGMFNNPEIPTDPEAVVDRFVDLVNTPAGSRPFRSVVGVDMGVTDRNSTDEEHEGPFLQAMGLEDFVKLRVS